MVVSCLVWISDLCWVVLCLICCCSEVVMWLNVLVSVENLVGFLLGILVLSLLLVIKLVVCCIVCRGWSIWILSKILLSNMSIRFMLLVSSRVVF